MEYVLALLICAFMFFYEGIAYWPEIKYVYRVKKQSIFMIIVDFFPVSSMLLVGFCVIVFYSTRSL